MSILKEYGVCTKDGNGQICTKFTRGLSDREVVNRAIRKHGSQNVISVAREGKVVVYNDQNRSRSSELD